MRRIFITILTLTLISSCAKTEKEKMEIAKEKGMEAVKELHETMRSHLKKAMKEKGAEGAIEFCSSKALEFTKQVSDKVGLRIKRTSLKYRNEKDKPDELEKQVLTELENEYISTGKLPDYLIKKAKIDGKDYFVFFKTIKVKKPCLKCHGDINKMDPKIVETLRKLYPDDKAINYKEGDFRGVIRVDIPADKVN
jgi:hypothetical protein